MNLEKAQESGENQMNLRITRENLKEPKEARENQRVPRVSG